MLVGHQKQWQILKGAAEEDRLSHAYLFFGQEKLGKKTLALELISYLFGQTPNQLIAGGHPDFILITPINKEIQISQIRDLIWRLSLKPSIAPLKATIIDQAHLMNQEAQNCLLKTLEEPKGKTLLILITEYPEMLFPTILSRIQKIKFYPLPKKEIENYLKEQGVEEKKAKIISQISQGRPGVAIDFLEQPEKLKEREKLIEELIKLTKSDLIWRFQYAKKISKATQLKEILNIWLSYFREKLISSLNSKGEPWKIEGLKKILEKIQKTLFLISTTNVNFRLTMETLMLELPFQGGTLEE
jgi:DNA polymerase-3 subunit delta'